MNFEAFIESDLAQHLVNRFRQIYARMENTRTLSGFGRSIRSLSGSLRTPLSHFAPEIDFSSAASAL
jgi:hypothetical protein